MFVAMPKDSRTKSQKAFLCLHNFVERSKLCSQKVVAKPFYVLVILFRQANYKRKKRLAKKCYTFLCT